jgi:predicted amidohydrolase YtcJ
VPVSFGSDWCAGPLNPVYGLVVSGTRINFKGKTDWGPEEKLELENSIKHWTIDSAKDLMMEEDVGSIEVGKYGDIVLWNQDPLKLNSWWFLLTHEIDT